MLGIGARDAPVIMSETPFKTPRTLWSIKTVRMQEGTPGPAARGGRELEQSAHRAYERQTGIQMEPLCLVQEVRADACLRGSGDSAESKPLTLP
jgi:predicted phage-related endonuclease